MYFYEDAKKKPGGLTNLQVGAVEAIGSNSNEIAYVYDFTP